MVTQLNPNQAFALNAILVGRVTSIGAHGSMSAIHKCPIDNAIRVSALGLTGDEHADRTHHGGAEKAMHHYPLDHYFYWYGYLRAAPRSFLAGAFGENLSTYGLTETNVCIGDVFNLGSSVIQVTQPRQPCWKLNVRFNHTEIARHMQRTGLTGWYYRVLKEGITTPQDKLIFLSRLNPKWSITNVTSLLHSRELGQRRLEELASASGIGKSLLALIHRRLSTGKVESWTSRLDQQSMHP